MKQTGPVQWQIRMLRKDAHRSDKIEVLSPQTGHGAHGDDSPSGLAIRWTCITIFMETMCLSQAELHWKRCDELLWQRLRVRDLCPLQVEKYASWGVDRRNYMIVP